MRAAAEARQLRNNFAQDVVRTPRQSKGQQGEQQLRSELAAANFRLQVTRERQDPLVKLVGDVDQVRMELGAERQRCGQMDADRQHLEAECDSLSRAASEIEAALRVPHRQFVKASNVGQHEVELEAMRWRQHALELETESATMDSRIDGLQSCLHRVRTQEQADASELAESRSLCAAAENQEMVMDEQAQSCALEVQELQQAFDASCRDVMTLREALHEARVQCSRRQESYELLAQDAAALQAEWDAQHEAHCETLSRVAELQSQNESLEVDLKGARVAVASTGEASGRRGVIAERSLGLEVRDGKGAGEGFTDAQQSPPFYPLRLDSPPSLPLSRLSYPRSAHARQERRRMLRLQDQDARRPTTAPA